MGNTLQGRFFVMSTTFAKKNVLKTNVRIYPDACGKFGQSDPNSEHFEICTQMY